MTTGKYEELIRRLTALDGELERQQSYLGNHENAEDEPIWSTQRELMDWSGAVKEAVAALKETI